MIKQFLIFCTVCVMISSCKTPAYVRQGVGNYNEAKTNIRDIINIDGYFVHAEPEDVDSSYTYFMFFEDGMVNMRVHDYSVFAPSNKDEDIVQYIRQVVSDENAKKSKMFYNSLGWGKYTITNDTIKINYHSGWGYPNCYAFEMWFKVIDRTHIVDIYFSRITADTPNMTEYQKNQEVYKETIPSRFIPLKNLPSSDCWLKKKKWFWKNESDWENYMEKIKKK